jgi:hypothetical protein
MSKIKIPNFKPLEFELYSDSDGFLGNVTEQGLDDVRLQCIINNVSDVYVRWIDKNDEDKVYQVYQLYIKTNGDMEWPTGFADFTQRYFSIIAKAKKLKKNEFSEEMFEKSLNSHNNFVNKFLSK